MADKEYL